MAREWFIHGEALMRVRGAAGTAIASLSELGLAADPITVTPELRHLDMTLDAWGRQIPADVQFMLAAVQISCTLINFDRDVIDVLLQESMGGASAVGTLTRAGTRLGNGNARFASGWKFFSVGIASPVANKPWNFYHCYLTGNPVSFPLGTEKSAVQLQMRAIPYTVDPWNGGSGANGTVIWDHTVLA